MAKADGLETSNDVKFKGKKESGRTPMIENHGCNECLDVHALSDTTGAAQSRNNSQCLGRANDTSEQPRACELCKADETAMGDEVFQERHREEIPIKDGDGVRTGGSGCSSPANSTPGLDRDLRLQVESPGAWSPSSTQVHFIADSPLTPTRFRSKSEADTSTNPIHAQAIVSTTAGTREHRTSSASAVELSSPSLGFVESPRGEPAGSASGSLSLHGTVTREGEMLSFVADDLLEKIRQSVDPLKAKDRGSAGSSACHTPSSACPTPSSSHSHTPSLSPSVVSTSSIPPVDPGALNDIERHCRRAADNIELMLGHISSMLQNMSAITVGHTQTYRDAVDKAGATVDQSVKCMYALIAKCEELNKTMEPVHELASQIKRVKRLLEDLEAACK